MILDSFRLDGDVALVTGAGRGLGRAMALGLAEAGADIVLAGRNRATLCEVRDEIRVIGRKALPIVTDVTKPRQLESLVRRALLGFRKIDILVNNAGTTHRAPAEDFPLDEWDRVMAVNLKAVFILSQLVGRHMKAQGGGRIINVTSLASSIGLPLTPAYVASKSGLAGLTRQLALDWAPHGIRVNAIGPGYFRTDLTAKLEHDPDRGPKINMRIPMKRWGTPDELKGAVVFLASKASAYVTGQTLYVDGGWLAN